MSRCVAGLLTCPSFDGFGSYPDYMQSSAVFKGIGRIAIEMYLLFQHHTTVEILRNVSSDMDLFTITGAGWHFVKFLGPAVVVVGPDCRSERTQSRVMAGPTYQGIFPKVATLPPSVQHCIWMVSVPVVYPRLETVETLANTLATGKRAVNTTYNLLGKVTSSVAGVVGGKEVVAQGFKEVKRAVGKAGLMGNVLNQFGEMDIAEDLKDLWTHESKDLERTYLIRTLQGIAQQKGIRMTFLSGGKFTVSLFASSLTKRTKETLILYQTSTAAALASCTTRRTRQTTRPCTRSSRRLSSRRPAAPTCSRCCTTTSCCTCRRTATAPPTRSRTPRRT